MNQQLIPVISSELIWRELNDGTVIVTPDEGKVRVLNQTGTAIWLLIDGTNSLGEISTHIASKFEVGQAEALRDAEAFLTDLSFRGLITISES